MSFLPGKDTPMIFLESASGVSGVARHADGRGIWGSEGGSPGKAE